MSTSNAMVALAAEHLSAKSKVTCIELILHFSHGKSHLCTYRARSCVHTVHVVTSFSERMNLWFRLFLMILRRPWRKAIDGMATTVVRMRVWPTDLDLNRHVTNGRYFSLADVARMDYVLRSGGYRVALRNRAVPIVGDTWGKFRRELRLFEIFELHTKLLGWDDKWIFVEHRFVRMGRVVGVVFMRGLFRSAKGSVPPSEFAREMGLAEGSPEMSEWLTAWSDSCTEMSRQLREEETVATFPS